jgi:hypothetical protein
MSTEWLVSVGQLLAFLIAVFLGGLVPPATFGGDRGGVAAVTPPIILKAKHDH